MDNIFESDEVHERAAPPPAASPTDADFDSMSGYAPTTPDDASELVEDEAINFSRTGVWRPTVDAVAHAPRPSHPVLDMTGVIRELEWLDAHFTLPQF